MRKKMTLLASILLFVVISSFFFMNHGAPEETEVFSPGYYAGPVRQAQKLSKTMPLTYDTSSLCVCFEKEPLACDRESLTWYLPVDMERDEWEAGSFSVTDEEFRIQPLQDYTLLDKKQTVADGMPIPFLVFSEKENCAAKINVIFTGLPVIDFQTQSDIDTTPAFAGRIEVYDRFHSGEWTFISSFEAHERGQTTRVYPKKGYRVNLLSVLPNGQVRSRSKSLLGMRDSDSWILYAIYSDGTKVRDKVNVELWNRFGAKEAGYDAHCGTHLEYAEVIMNGQYRGLYALMEPIDTTQLQMSDQDYLYKRTYGRELLSELLLNPKTEDYLTTLGMEIKGRIGSGTVADWRQFRNFTEICEEDDEAFAKDAATLLDMDSVVNIWIYLQMTHAEDNIYKNMFFAFRKEQTGYKLYLVPWDMDLTWGNAYVDDAEQLYCTFRGDTADQYLKWPFVDRLIRLNVGGIRERIESRWKELRGDVLSMDNLRRITADARSEVCDSGAFMREAARWPDGRHDAGYDEMLSYMEKRLDYLDTFLDNPVNWIQN